MVVLLLVVVMVVVVAALTWSRDVGGASRLEALLLSALNSAEAG